MRHKKGKLKKGDGEGGPEEDGCGREVVQEFVEQHPFSGSALRKTMMFVYLSSFPSAGNAHKFLNQLLPS